MATRQQRERKQARRRQHMEFTAIRGPRNIVSTPPPATREYRPKIRNAFTLGQEIVRNRILHQREGRPSRG